MSCFQQREGGDELLSTERGGGDYHTAYTIGKQKLQIELTHLRGKQPFQPLSKDTQFSLSLSPLYHHFMTSFEQSKRAAKDHTTLKTKHEEISVSVMLEHNRIIIRTCIYVHNIICVHAYHPLFYVPLKWCP